MTIPSTAITIDGNTAWYVGKFSCILKHDGSPHGPAHCGGAQGRYDPDLHNGQTGNLDRPCDTCDGTGTNRVNVNRSLKGLKGCAPCWCTGRHTFEILTSEVFIAGDGENAIRITALSVHVVEVLEIQNRSPFEIDTIWDREDDTYWWVVETPPQYNEPPEGLPVTLPADAAVGMRAVLMAVHT
jgi:hypothetical protein